jgi:hypothetical protein
VFGAHADSLHQPGRSPSRWRGSTRTQPERTHPLADTAAGLRYLEEGHARGKVVVTVT